MQFHRVNETVTLGPLGSSVADGSSWLGADEFPSSQSWADELERVLAFAHSRGGFERCLGDLRGSASQRDSALAELRVAFFLDRNGFRLVDWKPRGAGVKEGECSVACPSGHDIFVEVKSPGWESELQQAERLSGRTRLPKYINAEARFIDSAAAIRFAVTKAYPKFAANRKNLLVIADDLFVGFEHRPDFAADRALYARHVEPEKKGYFTDSTYERLGGVGIFWVCKTEGGPVGYDMRLFINSHAASSALPSDFVQAFHGSAG
jgi:hypothetical protein